MRATQVVFLVLTTLSVGVGWGHCFEKQVHWAALVGPTLAFIGAGAYAVTVDESGYWSSLEHLFVASVAIYHPTKPALVVPPGMMGVALGIGTLWTFVPSVLAITLNYLTLYWKPTVFQRQL